MVVEKFFFFFFSYLACRILVPQLGGQNLSPAVKAQTPNRWTASEFPEILKKRLTVMEMIDKFNYIKISTTVH